MRRELVTIGGLGSRTRHRRAHSMGYISPDIQIAAEALANHFSAHTPSQGLNNGVVSDFQTAWNKAPLAGSGIDVDDEYGPNTQVAFAMSLQAEGYPFTAPQNAYSSVLPAVPGRSHPAPAPPAPAPSPAPIVPSGGGGDGWLLPVALVGGGALVLWLLFRKKKPTGGKGPMVEIRHNRGRRRNPASMLFA